MDSDSDIEILSAPPPRKDVARSPGKGKAPVKARPDATVTSQEASAKAKPAANGARPGRPRPKPSAGASKASAAAAASTSASTVASGSGTASTSTAPAGRPRPRPRKAVPKVEAVAADGDDDDFFNRGARSNLVFRSKEFGVAEVSKGAQNQHDIVRGSTTTSSSPAAAGGRPSKSAEPQLIDLDTDSEESWGSSSSEGDSDAPRGKNKKSKAKAKAQAKRPDADKLEEMHPSSDLDLNTPRKHTYDTDSSIEQLTPSPAKSAGRRKSKRSRTRSITPPAAKAAHLIALNQDLQTLDAMMQSRGLHRPRQPHVSEIQQEEEIRRMLSAADDELDNDPAIAEAKRRVLARMEAQKTKDGAAARGLPIKFKVAMIFDPRKENASARAKAHFERPFEVEVGSLEIFEAVFNKIRDKTQIPLAEIAVTYADQRIYPSDTPTLARIFGDAELRGYHTDVYRHIKEARRPASPTKSASPQRLLQAISPPPLETSDAELDEPDIITIIVRKGQMVDLPLAVKPTTSCLAIIKQFLKETEGLTGPALTAKAKKCRLEYDGELLDFKTKVGETELDEDDLCDIVVP